MHVRRFRHAVAAQRGLCRGRGGEKATLKVKVAGRREFAGYWEYLLDNAIFTVPAYPLWGGSALIGLDGTLLGVGSLLVQEALGPGAPAFPGNMYVPINRLKPIFDELVSNRPAVDAAAAVARPLHRRAYGPARGRRHFRRRTGRSRRPAARRHPAGAERRGAGRRRRLLPEAVGERPGRHGGDCCAWSATTTPSRSRSAPATGAITSTADKFALGLESALARARCTSSE